MDKVKAFQVRLPKELWVFIKKLSIKTEQPMNELIIRAIEMLKKQSKEKVDSN